MGKQEPDRLAVLEPQMDEYYHAPFNAAMLHTAVLAYPERTVSVTTFRRHGEVLRAMLDETAPGLSGRVEWRVMERPRSGGMVARYRHNRSMLQEVLRRGEPVLMTSISRLQLLQLKGLMRGGDCVSAVLHGDLEQLEQESTEGFPKNLYGLKRLLRSRTPAGLKYILLGESIRQNVSADYGELLRHCGVVDHPAEFRPIAPVVGGEMVFGVLGNSGEGDMLEELARAVKARMPEVRIRMVGWVSGPAAVKRLEGLVEDAGDRMISREEYAQRMESLRYVVFQVSPGAYRLRASGSMFDALAYGKPLIYAGNPYLDEYLGGVPEAGVRVKSTAEMVDAICRLAENSDEAEYQRRVEAIARLRVRFTPEALAPVLRGVLED